MKKLIVSFIAIFFFISTGNWVSAEEKNPAERNHLSVSTVSNRPIYVDRLLYTALKDIDYKLELSTVTSLQQGHNFAHSGERDGVISSSPTTDTLYPGLIKVPVVLENINVLVFTNAASTFEVKEWKSLSGHTIGILKENVQLRVNIPPNTTVVTRETTKSLLEGLSVGEFDAAVVYVREYETFPVPDGIILAGQIDVLSEYLYLNKSFERVIPQIAKAIDTVLADGRGDKILNGVPVPEMYRRQTILHLVSENRELPREAAFHERIRSEFSSDNIEWYSLDLNFRRFSDYPNRLAYFEGLLRQDSISRDIAAVIVSGEDALDFLEERYSLLFKNTPVFYYGIDEERAARAREAIPNSTGIVEDIQAFETVSEALTFFPNTKKLFVLNDFSKEGISYQKAIRNDLARLSGISVEYNKNEDIDSLLEQIRALPEDSLILAGSYFIDSGDQYFFQNEIKKILEDISPVPIFTIYSTFIPYSAIGGKCLDYGKYGEIVASILRQILGGGNVSDIPIITSGSDLSRWSFDRHQLHKWGINAALLPKGSEILNRIPSIWETNPMLAYTILAAFVLGIILIICLTLFLNKFRKQNIDLIETRKTLHTAEELLAKDNKIREVKERLEGMINAAPAVAYTVSVDNVIVEANEYIRTITGINIGDDSRKLYLNSEKNIDILSRLFEGALVANEIIEIPMVSGEMHRFLTNMSLAEYESRMAVVAWGIDIERAESQKDELENIHEKLVRVYERMSRTLRAAPIFYSMMTIDGIIAEINQQFGEAIGLQVGDRLSDGFTDPSEFDLMLENVLRDGSLYNHIIRTKFTDGTTHRLIANLAVVDYGDKNAVVTWAMDNEKEELKKELLLHQRRTLQSILDTMPLPIVIIDAETFELVYANNNCLMLLGTDSIKSSFRLDSPEAFSIFSPADMSVTEYLHIITEAKEPVTKDMQLHTFYGNTVELRVVSCHIEYNGRKSVSCIMTDLTDEKKYKRSGQNLQLILDTLPIPVRITSNKDFRILYANNNCAKLFKFETPNDMVGLIETNLLAELQNGDTSPSDLIRLSHEKAIAAETTYLRSDGSVIETQLITCPIDYMGKEATLGIIRDLAQELEQRRIRKSLQTVLDALPIPVRILDVDTSNIIYVNNSLLEMFEYESADELLGEHISKLVPKLQRTGTATLDMLATIYAAEGGVPIELEYISKTGKSIDSILIACRVQYRGQNASLGIIKDLSAEKEQERMRLSLQMILDTMPIPVRIADCETYKVVYGNDAYFSLLELDSTKRIGAISLTDNLAPIQSDGNDVYQFSKFLVSSPDTVVKDFQAITDKGKPLDIRVISRPIDYMGRESIIGIMTDLSAEREYERMLLNAAEKEKEANLLKSRFLVNMSHEIRTPMNAIIGLTEIELRKELQKETKSIFQKISTSANSLLQIINEILDLSKIEADKLVFVSEEFELEEVLHSALLVVTPRLEDKSVELMLNSSVDLPKYIVGDKTRLWQILKNFLDNSAKFTDSGKIVLTATSETIDAETVVITFTVKDTGVGMSTEQLNAVFMPYEQFYSEAQKRFSGTGLGMPIAKQLCEIMGGHIEISSSPGEGTTITASIPFKLSNNNTALIPKNSTLSGKNILVVDDDEIALDIAEGLLKYNEATFSKARNGFEAMSKVLKNRDKGVFFDAILLDYKMNGLDGLETARQIQLSLSTSPKLLMVTAYQKSLLRDDLKDSNICDVIEKPFIPSHFIQRLSEALGYVGGEQEGDSYIGFKDVNALICEDNLLNQEVAVGMFKYLGVSPVVAGNGKHALDILKKDQSFDIIFMDLQMPVMDGYETAREIRKDKRFENVPIISLTADAMPEIAEKCLQTGMNDHLAKPIDFDSLYERLVKWLPAEKRVEGDILLSQKTSHEKLGNVLARFQGDHELYKKALKLFVGNLPDKWPPFSEMLGDLENTLFYLHNLKGMAGNLSEKDVYNATVRFEKALKASNYDRKLYKKLVAASDAAKERIIKLIGISNTSPSEVGTISELLSILNMLEDPLVNCDPVASSEIIEQLNKKEWADIEKSTLDHICRLVSEYDFDEALEVLRSILESLLEGLV